MAPSLGPHVVDRAMQQASLVGGSPPTCLPSCVELREPRRVEPAQRGVGRRHQPAVGDAHADVARGAGARPARRSSAPSAQIASRGLRSSSARWQLRSALVKKSGAPKLPDFSASASGLARPTRGPRHAGIDLRADAQRRHAERRTTAPEVSPPATTSRRDARRDQALGERRHGLLDQRAGSLSTPSSAAAPSTASGGRGRTDQDRAVAELALGPGQRLARRPARRGRSRRVDARDAAPLAHVRDLAERRRRAASPPAPRPRRRLAGSASAPAVLPSSPRRR